jgi:hypothetical protein
MSGEKGSFSGDCREVELNYGTEVLRARLSFALNAPCPCDTLPHTPFL